MVMMGARAGRAETPPCPPAGQWIAPACGEPIAADHLIDALARHKIVLLGEHHNDADHHLWQLATLAALYGRRPDLVIGFEAFPRRLQGVLDRWVAGELGEAEFLEAAEWRSVWGFDAGLYLPLFRFARMFRLPMLALNVDRPLVRAVAERGFAALSEAEREGIGAPAAAPAVYRHRLAAVYGWKAAIRRGEADASAPPLLGEEEFRRIDGDAGFGRFVEAQATWDRAMAEALAAAARPGGPLVVGLVGRGHVEYGWGIPHQLAALGLPGAAVLLAERRDVVCAGLAGDVADAVFVLDSVAPPAVDP